jgi:hypothetical protein
MKHAAAAALFAGALWAAPLHAQSLGPNGSRIQTSNYKVDLTEGPVLASTRVIGLGGAYTALADGTEGNTENPVAPAVRNRYSIDHFDYDIGFGLTFPESIANNDFFNTGQAHTDLGKTSTTGFVFLDVAGNLQFGSWGLGLTIDAQRYGLELNGAQTASLGPGQLDAEFLTGHLLLAKSFATGQLLLGAGLRFTGMDLIANNTSAIDTSSALFSTSGTALEAGALWRPNGMGFRVGAALRSAVNSTAAGNSSVPVTNGNHVIGDPTSPNAFFLPNDVSLPWDASFGLAVQFGPRPFNPRWWDPSDLLRSLRRSVAARANVRAVRRAELVAAAKRRGGDVDAATRAIDAELATEAALDDLELDRAEKHVRDELKQRYRAMSRFYLLVTTSLDVIGPVDNAVGVQSFLEQTVNRSGEHVTYSPRLGVETEVVPHWVKLRAGSYIEPSRFDTADAHSRVHGTGGFDVKLFPWTVFGLFDDGTEWRAGGAVDFAARYFGWSAAIGVWH